MNIVIGGVTFLILIICACTIPKGNAKKSPEVRGFGVIGNGPGGRPAPGRFNRDLNVRNNILIDQDSDSLYGESGRKDKSGGGYYDNRPNNRQEDVTVVDHEDIM